MQESTRKESQFKETKALDTDRLKEGKLGKRKGSNTP